MYDPELLQLFVSIEGVTASVVVRILSLLLLTDVISSSRKQFAASTDDNS